MSGTATHPSGDLANLAKALELKKLERDSKYYELQMQRNEMRMQEVKRRMFIRLVIAIFLAFVMTAAMWFLFTREIPERNRDVVVVLIGGLAGAFTGAVVNYYFGDSEGRPQPAQIIDKEDKDDGNNGSN
jgi:membrane protein DedA with SNARE-associated domain